MNTLKNVIAHPHLSTTGNLPPSVENSRAEWVTAAIERGLCEPGDSWIGHVLLQVKDPNLRYRKVGGFDRSKIQALYSRVEGARATAQYSSEKAQKEGTRDLEALERAGEVLRELLEEERREQARLSQPLAAGPESVMFPAPPTHVAEAEQQSQPEPALPPSAPLSGRKESASEALEPNLPAPRFKVDLLDPRHIKFAREFVESLTAAREHLWQTDDEEQIKKVVDHAELLTALAKTLELGEKFEMEGKALRWEAYRRVAELRGPISPGRPKKGSPPPPVLKGFESKADQKNLALAGNWDRSEFESLLQEGIEKRNLSQKTFQKKIPLASGISESGASGELSGAPDNSKTGQTQPESQPDFRLFFRALKDITKNPGPYVKGAYAKTNEHEWAKIVMGGYRSTIRSFARKLIELLGPDDCAPGGGYRMPRIPSESEVLSPSEETTLSI